MATAPFTDREQELYDYLRRSLPGYLFSDPPSAYHVALVKMFGASRDFGEELLNYMRLRSSYGIWVDEHAYEHGTRRAAGEDDPTVKARLAQPELTLTRPNLLALIGAILAAAGIAGTPVMFTLRKEQAFCDRDAYCDRGNRAGPGGPPNVIVVILPYGTTAAAQAAVDEAMRTSSGEGFTHVIEVRANP